MGRTKPVMDALAGIRTERVPIWIMRQAGRYLPEYRELRAKAGSFLDLCFTPELAVEATLQPIRRFEFDAAILFSDILVVPHALGQKVWFVDGEGPRLSELRDLSSLSRAIDLERVGSVFEAIRTLRGELSPTTTLLGFCGAPWTVAGYMIAGRGGESLEKVRHVIYQQPKFLKDLIGLLETASISYLSAQIEAGADAVQIFESFAGSLPPQFFRSLSLDPISRIVSGVRERHPTARIIVFARGAGPITRVWLPGRAPMRSGSIGAWTLAGRPAPCKARARCRGIWTRLRSSRAARRWRAERGGSSKHSPAALTSSISAMELFRKPLSPTSSG